MGADPGVFIKFGSDAGSDTAGRAASCEARLRTDLRPGDRDGKAAAADATL